MDIIIVTNSASVGIIDFQRIFFALLACVALFLCCIFTPFPI